MNVLLIVPSLARKGPVIVARDIVDGLRRQGHGVEVWFLDEKMELEFPCTVRKFSFSCLCRLKKFDVIHSHSLRPDALAWVLRNVLGHKAYYVTTIHNYVEQDLAFAYGRVVSAVFSRVWRFLWRGKDMCVALTRHARDYYRETQPKLRLSVVYNGRPTHLAKPVPAEDLSIIDKMRARYRIIGASALVTSRKGFDQVIKALPLLPDHAFLLVGEGPALAELYEIARNEDVADRFVCLGFRDNARDYLAHMDIYAMPSYSEGMPLAMLEAASAGVPIVCSNIPVFLELFDQEEAGFFELNNASSLQSAVHLAELRATRQAWSAKSRFEQNYSVDAMADGYIDVYRQSQRQPGRV